MIDVSRKYSTLRTAVAVARLNVSPATIKAIREGRVPKGDPLTVARVAAVQAAKNTAGLIPYCHPVPLDHVRVDFRLGTDSIEIEAEVKAIWKTGVEMEAMTAASVAALTIYDMLKMIDDDIVIVDIRLKSKTGGKSDLGAAARDIRAAVLVASDSVSEGRKVDSSGKTIIERLKIESIEVALFEVLPDDADMLASALRRYADEEELDLVITTGGTGLGPRDVTPQAMAQVVESDVPGIAEAIRSYGLDRTPLAMLSRARAGVRGKTLIVNLPGSERAVRESLDAIFPAIKHAISMIQGDTDHQPAELSQKAER